MAEWNWHVALARDVIKVFKPHNEHDFVLGSLLPDVPWMSVEEAIQSGIRERLHMAKMMANGLCSVADLSMWLDRQVSYIKGSDLYYGYLTHIVLDETLNQAWNMITKRVSLSKFLMKGKSGSKLISIDSVARTKWNDLGLYAKKSFGCQADYVPRQLADLSNDACEVLSEDIGLNAEEIQEMLDKIPDIMKRMINVETGSFIINKAFYDSIHSECTARCARILSMVDSF